MILCAHLTDSLAWRPPGIAACSCTSACRGGRTGRQGAETQADNWDGEDFQTRSSSVLAGHSGLEITRPEFGYQCHYTQNYGERESKENDPMYWRMDQNTPDYISGPRRLPEFIWEKVYNKNLLMINIYNHQAVSFCTRKSVQSVEPRPPAYRRVGVPGQCSALLSVRLPVSMQQL
jgi:hypothetical protein